MNRKRVLVITYYWPPSGGSGVQRWVKFVKYLREFGWEPVVYTPGNPEPPAIDHSLEKDIPEGLEVIKTPIREPYSLYKKFTRQDKNSRIGAAFLSEKKKPRLAEKISIWIRGNLFIPDARFLWIKPSIRFLTRYLRENPVDAIATTGPPHSMHLIGLGLKRRLNIPWLADFRDPWTEIDYHEDLMLTRRAEKKHRRLEKTVLDEADRILVVSPSMQEALAAQTKTPVDLLTNGYDEDDFESNVVQPDKTFTISYTGNFVRSQNPVILWKALSDILKEDPSFGKHLKIHLIGKMDFAIKGSLIAHGLMPYVEETGYVSHNCAITYQKRSQILLVILKQVPIAGRFLPGKFFEYLAAHRPILCVGPPESDTGKILRACNAGTIVDYDDYESTKTAIIHFYSHYKKGQLTSYNKGIEYYSRKKLTGRLSEIMYSMT